MIHNYYDSGLWFACVQEVWFLDECNYNDIHDQLACMGEQYTVTLSRPALLLSPYPQSLGIEKMLVSSLCYSYIVPKGSQIKYHPHSKKLLFCIAMHALEVIPLSLPTEVLLLHHVSYYYNHRAVMLMRMVGVYTLLIRFVEHEVEVLLN